MGDVNILSLIIATLLPMIIGFIYYGKGLFGKAWMESIGMTEEKAKSANMGKVMGISIVMSFLIAFFMLQFCNGLGQEGQFDTFKHGAAHGIIVSLFLVVPIFISNGLFEQKSWKNMLINGLYWVITLALMGGVLDSMNHFPNS
ncbi:MAG: DUF1761 domain-containing protein [Saprospiraceae bacterium]|jgi:hypothetical protein|nr:DUF1761 domain-containing protein [Saprospiraceae bacterium]MBL0023869.1 DUF1761 domain-containing protein [Saprospiraceae bacterium]